MTNKYSKASVCLVNNPPDKFWRNYGLLSEADLVSILPQPLSLPLLNALFAGNCVLCEGQVTSGMICNGCIEELAPIPCLHCQTCALPLENQHTPCPACLKAAPAYNRVYAAFLYTYPFNHVIHAYKYLHHHNLAPWLAAQIINILPNDFSPDEVLSVPLHPNKLRERGFNQAHEIAKSLAKQLGYPLSSQALIRHQSVIAQVNASLSERQQQIRGAFWCNRDFSGKTLLLVDDVLTTGSTASECARILKLHGAKEVHIAVCARTPQKFHDG